MIKHIVMWKLHETAAGRSKEENAKLLKQKLEAMPAQIPELKKAEVELTIIFQMRPGMLSCIRNSTMQARYKPIRNIHCIRR